MGFKVKTRNTRPLRNVSFRLLLIVIWPMMAEQLRKREVPRNPSAQTQLLSREKKDLHVQRVDPSELMRPAVWASIMSWLHPEPGRVKSCIIKF